MQRSVSFGAFGALYLVVALTAIFLAAPGTDLRRTDAGTYPDGRLDATALAPNLEETDLSLARSALQLSGRRTGVPASAAALLSNGLIFPAMATVAVLLLAFRVRPGGPVVQPYLRGPPLR